MVVLFEFAKPRKICLQNFYLSIAQQPFFTCALVLWKDCQGRRRPCCTVPRSSSGVARRWQWIDNIILFWVFSGYFWIFLFFHVKSFTKIFPYLKYINFVNLRTFVAISKCLPQFFYQFRCSVFAYGSMFLWMFTKSWF